MRYVILLVLIFSVLTGVLAQGTNVQSSSSLPLSFPDSVKAVLDRTRNTTSIEIGQSFVDAWSKLGIDQQNSIRKQTFLMRKKKYPFKTSVSYFNALANAVNVEHADASKLSEYISVSQQVIENLEAKVAANFFERSRKFFQYHALNYDRAFRLYARDDNYHFEYIAPPPSTTWDETSSDIEATEDLWSDAPVEDAYDEETYDTQQEELQQQMPAWMTPPVQPEVYGPVIRFNALTLNFVTKYDSVFLKNTKGSYALIDGTFVGESGRFDWSPAGLSPESVYCDFTTYTIKSGKPELKAELVKLNYVGKTPGAVAGTFEFKSQPRKDSVDSSYPRFKSYQSDLDIKGFGSESMTYRGGFALLGKRVASASVNNDLSTIEVTVDGQRKFTAKSPLFEFQDSTVAATNTRLKIYQSNDSIVHPSVRLKYYFGSERVVIQHEKGGMHYTPYSSPFFNVDFNADVIKWDLKSDSLDLFTDGARNTDPMVIESVDHYSPEDFRLLKGKSFSFHPLTLVAGYCLKNRVREFYGGDLANYSRKDVAEIRMALEFLSQKGMIYYDTKTDRVRVREKAIEVYKSFKEESDFDNLKIHSVIDSSANATINFPNRYMTVRGVEEFSVSDSLNVVVKPHEGIIIILQNRDIKFDGTVNAGGYEISGKNFTLKYDSFFINLPKIDSINFYVTEKNAKGQATRRKVNNSLVGADSLTAAEGGLGNISQSSGVLYISRPNNKSGKQKTPAYPKMDASTGGVIYFDREEVLGGVYDRSIFFAVPPFKLDSLNDTDLSSLNFEGQFVSSGVFPSFKEKLRTMPDKSLGFDHAVPKTGYQLYKGDGRLNGAITLSNRGLRASGKIQLLATTVNSPDFIFYPDSVTTIGNRARIEEKQFGSVIFPQASLPDFEMKWYPKEDRMMLKNLHAPFNFYDSTAQLNGEIAISKEGVTGAGRLDTRGTELLSKEILFGNTILTARHAKFRANSNDPKKPLLFGTDIRVSYNVDENYADISPEVEGVAAINFPYAQVKTSIPNARMDFETKKIVMNKNPDVAIENSYFYTTREELDSLAFNADHAEYDLTTQELKVSGIPYIIVADAKITPENNEVLILENAKIGTLTNTTIILDTLNGYHRLTEGVVDIKSRKEFSGHATYQYVNVLQDTFAIKMTDFHLEAMDDIDLSKRKKKNNDLNPTLQTVATGEVTEKANLVLGAGMYYKGNMKMFASKPALQLDGYVKLNIKNIDGTNPWIQYAQTGDEPEVLVDFDNALNEDSKKVDAGLHFAVDNHLYITFLNDKRSDDDDDLFIPSGTLHYDAESKEYRIEDREKAAGNKLSGKVFSYNDESRQIRFEGPINLVQNVGDFSIKASALGSGNLANNEIRMNSLMAITSNIPSQALDIMATDIQNVIKNEGADDGLGDQTELLYKVADIIGERAVKDFEQQSLAKYVSLGTLNPLARALVVSNVNLKWSDKKKAFYSEGSVGISNILQHDINGGFEGFLEVKRGEDGSSVFNLFIKASPESWYYFGFEGSRVLVQSSNNAFNTIISKRTNAGKAKIGEVAFVPGSDEETLSFINRFRQEYYGIEAPYNLYAGSVVTNRDSEVVPANVPVMKQEPPKDEKKKEEEDDDEGF